MSQHRDEPRRVRSRAARATQQATRERLGKALSARRSMAIGAAIALVALASSLVTDATAGTGRRADRRRGTGAQAHGTRHHGHAAARTVKVNDHAHLSLRKAYGPVLLEEGSATGTLPGRTIVRLVEKKRITATFTIHAPGGSIVGSGGAALHSTGRFASFGGWLKVSHGTGRYRNAHGSGRLYGVIDRRRHTLTVTTTGTLHY